MRLLELVFVVVIICLLCTTAMSVELPPRMRLRNDVLLLKLEAQSIAELIAESGLISGGVDISRLYAVLSMLVPPGWEFQVVIQDDLGNRWVVGSAHFDRCSLAASATVVFSDPRTSRIYLVTVSLGVME